MKKLLIVDDEIGTRESLKMIFKKDAQLFFASDGQEALKIFEKEKPHLVLLDIILPDLDGLKVLQRMRSIQSKAKIIMITATRMVKTASNAMKLGAVDYITKPFDVKELRIIVNKSLENADLEGEGSQNNV